MALLPNAINVSEQPEMGEWAPIPEGEYDAIITNTELKPTNAGDGQYLQVDIEVTSGDHKGRKVTERLNFVNSNERAVKIAERILGSIGHAVGFEEGYEITDSNEIHNKPFVIKVKVEEPQEYTDKYGEKKMGSAQNSISSYKRSAFPGDAPSSGVSASTTVSEEMPGWSS
jgi:hypothetical protein